MLNVLLTIHMIACVALVIAVMLQRSEGGALGMGGGGTGGLISGRGAAGVLVKTTMGLAAVFFVTSITMTRLNNDSASQGSILERQADETVNPFDTLNTTPGTTTAPDPLGATPPATNTAPAAPTTTTPATPAPAPSTAPDPLAPATNTAPATTPPATTAPTTPAPTPENGGSPN